MSEESSPIKPFLFLHFFISVIVGFVRQDSLRVEKLQSCCCGSGIHVSLYEKSDLIYLSASQSLLLLKSGFIRLRVN